MSYDVAIVGASAIGCYTAKLIAEKGFSVILLEEHCEIGYPVQCAGLVSPRVIEITNAKRAILKEFKSAKIRSSNEELFVEAKDTKAVAIDRAKFDKILAKEALNKGVELLLGAKAISAKRISDRSKIYVQFLKDGKEDTLECNIFVGADGANSVVAKAFQLSRPKELLSGISAEIVFEREQDYIDIFVARNLAPDFFAWVIPLNGVAKIGLCARANTYRYFKKFLDLLNSKKLISFNAGIIPLGLAERTYTDNVMLVGNSACQVKPLSGGGIYTGLVSAQCCAEVATQALEKGCYNAKVLKEYQRLWRSELYKELKMGLIARAFFKQLKDRDFDRILSKLNNDRTLALVSEYGDIDYHSKVIKALFRSPQTASLLMPLLKDLF
ncbi:MAG: NAD(P)/FAD-dependent oxidoreductase [Candidatus Thermoplasmatota archaeon]|nr:NAD(P)/FAD-dependent oxidoreductase [Candidatus Thermoplasmatota archaeon]